MAKVLLWSVMNVQDIVAIEPETSEECTTRQVLLETSTRKQPMLRNITSIQVVTISVHPKVYPIVKLVNLLEISSGEAGVSQTTKEEDEEAKIPTISLMNPIGVRQKKEKKKSA